jgi:hypothetical protein
VPSRFVEYNLTVFCKLPLSKGPGNGPFPPQAGWVLLNTNKRPALRRSSSILVKPKFVDALNVVQVPRHHLLCSALMLLLPSTIAVSILMFTDRLWAVRRRAGERRDLGWNGPERSIEDEEGGGDRRYKNEKKWRPWKVESTNDRV